MNFLIQQEMNQGFLSLNALTWKLANAMDVPKSLKRSVILMMRRMGIYTETCIGEGQRQSDMTEIAATSCCNM